MVVRIGERELAKIHTAIKAGRREGYIVGLKYNFFNRFIMTKGKGIKANVIAGNNYSLYVPIIFKGKGFHTIHTIGNSCLGCFACPVVEDKLCNLQGVALNMEGSLILQQFCKLMIFTNCDQIAKWQIIGCIVVYVKNNSFLMFLIIEEKNIADFDAMAFDAAALHADTFTRCFDSNGQPDKRRRRTKLDGKKPSMFRLFNNSQYMIFSTVSIEFNGSWHLPDTFNNADGLSFIQEEGDIVSDLHFRNDTIALSNCLLLFNTNGDLCTVRLGWWCPHFLWLKFFCLIWRKGGEEQCCHMLAISFLVSRIGTGAVHVFNRIVFEINLHMISFRSHNIRFQMRSVPLQIRYSSFAAVISTAG